MLTVGQDHALLQSPRSHLREILELILSARELGEHYPTVLRAALERVGRADRSHRAAMADVTLGQSLFDPQG